MLICGCPEIVVNIEENEKAEKPFPGVIFSYTFEYNTQCFLVQRGYGVIVEASVEEDKRTNTIKLRTKATCINGKIDAEVAEKEILDQLVDYVKEKSEHRLKLLTGTVGLVNMD